MTDTRQEAEQELAYIVGKDRAAQLTSAVIAATYREAAQLAELLPTPDNVGEMSTFDDAWDNGTYAVAEALRARADQIHPA